MWKPSQSSSVTPSFTPEPPRPPPPAPPVEPVHRAPATVSDQATIGKGLFIKGEISGAESLYIDGKVEGSINLPGSRVTIGRTGQVAANVNARELVILGKIRGNVTVSDRVDIRVEGSLTGDVSAARISIEDGAFFKGGIELRKHEPKAPPPPLSSSSNATLEAALPVEG